MINFNFYKEEDGWKLNISENDISLSTICFGEDVSHEEIMSLMSIITKGDVSSVSINFINSNS